MLDLQHNSRGLVSHGLNACAGCSMELMIRHILDVCGSDSIVVLPPGCSALLNGFNNETCLKVSVFQGNLENTAACASGISRAYRRQGNDHTLVIAFAGDGGTMDIGLQSLSGMMERNDDVLYICYDNEAYMNTGIQGSSSTPIGAWSTTTPGGKSVHKKDLLGIAIAHRIPYCASASVANIHDLRNKVAKAKDIRGSRLLHIHCACPTGWNYPAEKTIEVARSAVNTGAWVLYEYENGKIKINVKPKELKPVSEYLGMQGRFRGMTDEAAAILQNEIVKNYQELCRKAELL